MVKDDRYWVHVFYVCGFLIAFYVMYQVFQAVGLYTGWVEKYVQWYSLVATIGGGIFGCLIMWNYIRLPSRRQHHESVIAELRKVTWPGLEDTKKMTWVVVVVVAFFSVVLGLFDFVWSWALKQMIT